MNTGKQQKPVLTGQRFKTRKRGECPFQLCPSILYYIFISFTGLNAIFALKTI